MRIVAALGGNALLRRGEPLDAASQRRNVERAAAALAPIAREHALVVTHGNGPQVGLLALESGLTGATQPYPLDILGAESQGMIGYMLEVALRNELPGRPLLTVLTQVEVAADDVAFAHPTKPIGPGLSSQEEVDAVLRRGWSVAVDGAAHRRVVASPAPLAIVERDVIAELIGRGTLVIAAGGGGVPVVRKGNRFEGVEAVIDKDMTAAMLAEQIEADWLLLLTDVPGVFEHWGPSPGEVVRSATPAGLRALNLPAGSMGPKAEAASRFVERTGGHAAIGAMDAAVAILAGEAGTHITDSVARGRIAG